ncbi:MAG TPA: ABC transporter substrate-binding protein [Mycobacteriales bacterium]|nr:ABC transporter substrate-binding protein [Mycobacteriales bacterium]
MKARAAILSAVATLSVTGLAFSGAAGASAPHSLPVPVDRQDYVTTVTTTNPVDGTTVDPYNGDPSVIHVGVVAGQELARSFVHVALDYLPAHARATQAVLRLHVPATKADASSTGVYPIYNVDVTDAIIEACVLTTELPRAFDSQHPPQPDCAHGSAAGTFDRAHQVFTVKLARLLDYWRVHGNTGLALLPIASDASATWSVAFSKGRSSALLDYEVVRPSHHGGAGSASNHVGGSPAAPPPAGSVAGGSGAGAGGGGPGPAASTGRVPPAGTTQPVGGTSQPPAVARSGSSATPSAAGGQRSASSEGNPAWPWVLAASLLVALGALAVAHRAAVGGFVRRIVPPGVAAFRTHPRAYSIACAALAWGLVFTSYSLVTTTHPTHSQQLASNDASAGGPSPSLPTAGTTTAPGQTPAATATGTAHLATTAGGTTSPVAGNGAGTGAGAVAQPSPQAAVKQEFAGPGTYRTINGIRVFFPAGGSAPVAQLYTGADDVIGLTSKTIKICAHAALTYGSAFNIEAKDLDVFWQYTNDHGGIFGRKIVTNYQNDNYDPGTAVQAAQTCKDWGTFFLLGGIGFDQIPAVRQWAEQNHELYLHHIATIQGSAGLRYSFSSQPTVEQVGTWFGQLAAQKFHGQKVGIIYRQSANWQPGVTTFERAVKAAGMQIVGSYGTTINQANYTQEIAQLHTAGAQVVFAWENALAETEMIKQAQGQNYHPSWLVFPFNLETNTLGNSAMSQQIWGISTWEAYDPGYYGGGFAGYADQIKEFEREYKQYDPQAKLAGDGGDLLFLNWEAQKGLAALLQACGPDCTRNKIAGLLLAGWHKPVPPNCPVNFGRTSDHHHGGYLFNVLHVIRDPNGRPNFVPVDRCAANL